MTGGDGVIHKETERILSMEIVEDGVTLRHRVTAGPSGLQSL